MKKTVLALLCTGLLAPSLAQAQAGGPEKTGSGTTSAHSGTSGSGAGGSSGMAHSRHHKDKTGTMAGTGSTGAMGGGDTGSSAAATPDGDVPKAHAKKTAKHKGHGDSMGAGGSGM